MNESNFNHALRSHVEQKNEDIFKQFAINVGNEEIEKARKNTMNLLSSAASQVCRNQNMQDLLFLPPPPPPELHELSSGDIHKEIKSDKINEMDTNIRYQQDLVKLKTAEPLFCKENDTFLNNCLRL